MRQRARDKLLRLVERLIRKTPSGRRVFFEPSELPWIAQLEAGWREIREELDARMLRLDEIPNFQQLSTAQYRLTSDDGWKVYLLYFYGHMAEQNCARCPRTTELIEKIPGLTTAFFSILAPHKHLPAHRGPYAGVLRYQLGLQVPEPVDSCRVQVAGETRHWGEGRSLVFDDSHLHEAWNESDGARVVLFVDFVRPLPFPLSACNRLGLRLMNETALVQEVLGTEPMRPTRP